MITNKVNVCKPGGCYVMIFGACQNGIMFDLTNLDRIVKCGLCKGWLFQCNNSVGLGGWWVGLVVGGVVGRIVGGFGGCGCGCSDYYVWVNGG